MATNTAANWTDNSVSIGYNYYYVVAGMNAVGLGANSPEAVALGGGLNVAGSLVVDLRAGDWTGTGTIWTNRAGLGDFTTDTAGLPVATTVAGVAAIQLNGTNGFVGPLAPWFVGNSPRTIEIWANNPTVADEETMVALGQRGSPDFNYAFNFGANASWGALAMYGDDLGWNGTPSANAWHHLVATYDGTNLILYADGVAKAATTRAALTPLGPIWIGSQTPDGITPGVGWFAGYLNAIRIHTGILSPAAVAANFNQGPAAAALLAPSGLLAHQSNQSVVLNWNGVNTATTYQVQRSGDIGGTYQTVAANLTTNGYTDATVNLGQTYFYTVTAVNGYMVGPASTPVSIYVAPPVLGFNLGGHSLQLNWPAWAGNWTLYQTTNLTPPVIWTVVTNTPASNGVFSVALPMGANAQYFRLVNP